MSGLFGRRNRSVSTQRNHGVPNTSSPAFAAASQAFLNNRQSNPNLSSAAAAAALRTMSPGPTRPQDIQTKRMVQRQTSSSPRGRQRGALRRTDSAGSMTERTFRSPSPGRPSTALGITRPTEPVPPLPQQHANVPPLPKKSKKRASSVDVKGPPRVQSPPLTAAGRGQSLNRTAPPPLKTGAPALQRINELERTDSRNSINFSYPRASPRAMSPPPVSNGFAASSPATRAAQVAPTTSRATTVLPPNARPQSPIETRKNATTSTARPQSSTQSRNTVGSPTRARPQSPVQSTSVGARPQSPVQSQRTPTALKSALSSAEAQNVQNDVARAAEQPVKKKKKKPAPEGMHLSAAALAPESSTTDSQAQSVVSESEDEFYAPDEGQLAVSGQGSHFPKSPTSSTYSDADSTPETMRRAQRASGALNKQPSVVREDWEGEQQQGPMQPRQEQDSSPTGSPAAVQSKKPTVMANESRKIEDPQSQASYNANTLSAPKPTAPEPTPSIYAATAPVPAPTQNYRNLMAQPESHNRKASLSPSRSVRIADRLTSDLTAGRKHEPMARSASPAKSALKHASPNGQGARRDSSVPPSEASDVSSASADGGLRKKKSVRVSFGGEPEIVGTAAEPVGAEGPNIGPQQANTKKGWLGSVKGKTAPVEDIPEEGMQPRPELPSFGSVRGKGTPKQQTPAATSIYSAVTASSASSEASSTSPYNTLDTSVSSDHAIGGLLSQDAQSKATYQARSAPQPASQLPLPPEVTSVEGSGYVSDQDDDIEDENETRHVVNEQQHSQIYARPEPSQAAVDVPTFSVQPPTPAPEQQKELGDQWKVTVPGGWYGEHNTEDNISHQAVQEPQPPVSTSSSGLGIGEQGFQSFTHPSASAQPTLADYVQSHNQERDSDDESIYSDAAQDPNELDGDGFGSINAIIESPIAPASLPRVKTATDSPLGQYESRPNGGDRMASWDRTQAHWSELRQGIQQPSTPTTISTPAPSQPASSQVQNPTAPALGAPIGASSFLANLHGAGAGYSPVTVNENPSSFNSTLHEPDSPLQASVQRSSPPPSPLKTRNSETKRSPPQGPLTHSMRSQPQQTEPKMRSSMRGQASPEPPIRTSSRPQAQQADIPHMKSSMRGQPQQSEPHMRSSMRGQAQQLEPSVRHSMRAQPQQPETQPMKKSMRNSTGQMAPTAPQYESSPAAKQPRGALQKKNLPPAVAAALPAAAASAGMRASAQPRPAKPAQPAPRVTNDSDSESSFRKARKPRVNNQFTMRSSMRAAPAPEALAPSTARDRRGIRSLSPVARRPFSPAPGAQKSMRSSMRGSVDAGVPTMRGQTESRRASSLTSRPKSTVAATPPRGKKSTSRFADSDDEEDPRTQSMNSRFVDSSDEEDSRTKLAPVRGIPRRTEEVDSTELEDSSDGGRQATKRAQPPTRIEMPPPSTTLGSDAPLSPNSEKKRGLFGMFKKKDKDENAKSRPVPQVEAVKANHDKDLEKNLSNGGGKFKAKALGFNSAAERDAMIAATQAKLEAKREQENPRVMSPAPSKANRRSTPQRMMSDGWPLPDKQANLENGRPSTAAGPGSAFAANKRGLAASRWASENTDSAQKPPPVLGKSGKKKRFPGLRRAFGLTD